MGFLFTIKPWKGTWKRIYHLMSNSVADAWCIYAHTVGRTLCFVWLPNGAVCPSSGCSTCFPDYATQRVIQMCSKVLFIHPYSKSTGIVPFNKLWCKQHWRKYLALNNSVLKNIHGFLLQRFRKKTLEISSVGWLILNCKVI